MDWESRAKRTAEFLVRWRLEVLYALVLGVLLVLFQAAIHPEFWPSLAPSVDSSGLIWQVQSTFLSVGFAGLAIATQLFVESPHAVGATRPAVLRHARVANFLYYGLAGNALIGLETIWFTSDPGVLLVSVGAFAPTVGLMVFSYVRIVDLFGNPSQLDQVVQRSLRQAVALRLQATAEPAVSPDGLESAIARGLSTESPVSTEGYVSVRILDDDLILRKVLPGPIIGALRRLSPGDAAKGKPEDPQTADEMPAVVLGIRPGERARRARVAFLVRIPTWFDDDATNTVTGLLLSSLQFYPPQAVTPYEETERELSMLKDTVTTGVRSGAFGSAERALALMGSVVNASAAHPAGRESLFMPTERERVSYVIARTEVEALVSPIAAGLLADQAMARVLAARDQVSVDGLDYALGSLVNLWQGILKASGEEYDDPAMQILVILQNLTEYAFAGTDDEFAFRVRSCWALVETVKIAIELRRFELARKSAAYLAGLFRYERDLPSLRDHTRGAQLVLSAWLLMLESNSANERPHDDELGGLLTPTGRWADLLSARSAADVANTHYSRWDFWEMRDMPSLEAKRLELPSLVDRALVKAMSRSPGRLPEARDSEQIAQYQRLLALLSEPFGVAQDHHGLRTALEDEIERWRAGEMAALASTELSPKRLAELKTAVSDQTAKLGRLSDTLPRRQLVPEDVVPFAAFLGQHLSVPREYLVDDVFNQTYADPKQLGQHLARTVIEQEDMALVQELETLATAVASVAASEVIRVVADLQNPVEYLLLVPFGGPPFHDWWDPAFQNQLGAVAIHESSALEDTVILFNLTTTLNLHRTPEAGLDPIDQTDIGIRVVDSNDAADDKPAVHIETGEHFRIWPGAAPVVTVFTDRPLKTRSRPDADNVIAFVEEPPAES